MDSDLCCPVCRDLFDDKTKSPRHLGCGHSLCSVCVAKLLRKKPLCPECRKRFSGNELNDCMINYPLLRLACSARRLEKDLTSDRSSEADTSQCQKNAGECTSHGCRLFFWCTHHCVWVCRDCLVLEHQRPPSGQCLVVAAVDAIDLLKKIQLEKIVSKFKDIESLKSHIEDDMKNTEGKIKRCNDLRIKFDEWEKLVISEIESSMDSYKKHLSNIGVSKTTLSKLKLEWNSALIFDNIVNMVKNTSDILDTVAENIAECKQMVEQSSCKSEIQDPTFFISDNKVGMTDKEATHIQMETIHLELTAAYLQIQGLKNQATAHSNVETILQEKIRNLECMNNDQQ
ncbi:unnamed protein product, partial [Meganyctiphanes norvegica]